MSRGQPADRSGVGDIPAIERYASDRDALVERLGLAGEGANNQRRRHEALRARIFRFLHTETEAGSARLERARPACGAAEGLPRVVLTGAPPERARAAGVLFRPVYSDILAAFFSEVFPPGPRRIAGKAALRAMVFRLPSDLRAEISALADAGGVGRGEALALTVSGDTHVTIACSTIAVGAPRSATGSLLVGRNLDFTGFGLSDVAAHLTVHRPAPGSSEIPHAALGWLGLWGIHTGWNAAGLCLGNMQAYNVKPASPRGPLELFSGRMPTSWAFTRMLRSCRTVAEAIDFARAHQPLSSTNLMLGDATGDAAVLEWGPLGLALRRMTDSVVFSTNFFLDSSMTDEVPGCWRLGVLRERLAPAQSPTIDVARVKSLLDEVNQGELTLHSVVFEPAARRLHIATGLPPSSRGPWMEFPWDPGW